MIITIDNKKYDVTEFLNEHPGGKDVFIDGTDMTTEFNNVGHSKSAIKMLEKYLIHDAYEKVVVGDEKVVGGDEKVVGDEKVIVDDISIPDFLYRKLKSNNIFKKLFTHEDYLNIHKIFGGIVLINFLYSVFDLYYSGCKGVFTIRKFGFVFFAFLIVHLLLSLSALQFNIPLNTNYTTISIGQEYRLHSILFVIRSFLVILVLHFLGKTAFSQIIIFIIVIFNMYSADLISYFYKPKNDKLGFKIGSMPFWSNCPSEAQHIITSFYNYVQLVMTLFLINMNSSIEVNLFAIFIIQITAFMGTLSKKGIINNFQWHAIYLFQYFIFYFLFFNDKNIVTFNSFIIGSILWVLRTKLSMNKFFLWSCVFAISLFTKYSKNNYVLLLGILFILYSGFNFFGMCFDKRREKTHNIIKSNIQVSNTKLHIIDIKMKNSLIEYDLKPGQYFNLYIDKEKRPYTPIDYDMSNNSIQFFIKDYSDYGNNKISERICAFKKDMSIHLDGPFGKNYYDKNSDSIIFNNIPIEHKNILMFYCGTGITPFCSILNNINTDTKYKFKLFGSLKNDSENYLQISNKNVKQKIYYSDNKLTYKTISKILKKYNPLNTIILLCGSESYNNMIINSVDKKFTICKW
jgi:NAD(P)H-flavin reductase